MPSLRDQVRQRAKARCEYCQLPQTCTVLPHEIDHILANGDAGAVAEDVDAFPLADRALDGEPTIGSATDVAFCEERFPALGSNLSRGFLALLRIDVEHRDERSHLSEADGNAAPDAGGAAGNHGDLALQREKLGGAFGDLLRLSVHRRLSHPFADVATTRNIYTFGSS